MTVCSQKWVGVIYNGDRWEQLDSSGTERGIQPRRVPPCFGFEPEIGGLSQILEVSRRLFSRFTFLFPLFVFLFTNFYFLSVLRDKLWSSDVTGDSDEIIVINENTLQDKYIS